MLDELVNSLLYEGYALYPYTPGSTKNATPTPFGIVYPPAYAAQSASTFDVARIQCIAQAPPDATLTATVWFLVASGDRHEAAERSVELGPAGLGERVSTPFPEGRLTLSSEQIHPDRWRVTCSVHNALESSPDIERGAALLRSLISTHIVLRVAGGTFVSPLEAEGCESVNSYPVLATPEDDAILGAAIVLPDHPQISPKSRINLFDNTEIEEALMLHVHVLSEEERESMAEQDPVVREMIQRALAATPADIIALHGGFSPTDILKNG
ncbi:MAG TPA: hypothetical protein VG165_09420 [Solirubrobacteraceae bacterium]|jgi:hypothetical protein|nr:hypothetical protein [Solirubrobacteraceae bacterium]